MSSSAGSVVPLHLWLRARRPGLSNCRISRGIWVICFYRSPRINWEKLSVGGCSWTGPITRARLSFWRLRRLALLSGVISASKLVWGTATEWPLSLWNCRGFRWWLGWSVSGLVWVRGGFVRVVCLESVSKLLATRGQSRSVCSSASGSILEARGHEG